MFCTFWLPNVLFATAACIFSTSELQKVLRTRQVFCTFWLPNVLFATARVQFFDIGTSKSAELVLFATAACKVLTKSAPDMSGVLYIFTSKCVFRHSGVQFLISPLSSYLRTRRFNRPTFGLTRHTNHWKNTAFRDFSNIWRGCIFFLLTFALLHLLSADLTTLLCFSTVHIVGSFYLNFLRSIMLKFPSLSQKFWWWWWWYSSHYPDKIHGPISHWSGRSGGYGFCPLCSQFANAELSQLRRTKSTVTHSLVQFIQANSGRGHKTTSSQKPQR